MATDTTSNTTLDTTPDTASNPLLDFSGLTRFDLIEPQHVTPALDLLLKQSAAVIAELEAPTSTVSWDNFVEPLGSTMEKLGRAWGVLNHLNAVADTPELRAAYNENEPRLVEFSTSVGLNQGLFQKYKALHTSADYVAMSPARRRVIDNAVLGFRLSGAELPEAQKERFAAIQEQHAALTTRFSENVLDAISDYSLLVADESELAGLPEDAKQAAQAAAQKDGLSGFKFTLHFPSYFPLLQYADNRALRETIYRANTTKASDLGAKPEWDNSQNMRDILRLSEEEAQLLGYANYAELSLVTKMAKSPQEVVAFLEDLGHRARPFAEQDLSELRTFAREQLALETLEAWDIAYASEKLREQRYAFSEQEVKQYFPEPKVLAGLFHLVQQLFGVSIGPDSAPVWHPDIRFYRIERDGKLIGQFYLDLYARSGKRGGAWMDGARSRHVIGEKIQTPVAYLTCNFTAPATVDGVQKAALFTHDEVITLFHEFGHGLHHMLTQVDEMDVSGISGVEWDAVELPSQFMENFCWEWAVLQELSAHADKGLPLPRDLFDKMTAAKNFQSGLGMLRQVEFSLFDMHIHNALPNDDGAIEKVLDTVRAQFAVLQPPAFNRFQHSFEHIFTGGYAAGYYSYKWAEVLSADAYAAFEEAGVSNGNIVSQETGQRFQREILAVGGSRPALESFKAFRGREPSITALLRHSGMAA
ncbi:M3 family metallopeptidase [Herbaspirillum sp. RTI4]|uniref:M3 family metallopeptidase n=1 Tax=Herbaspirillum sp. RTI4 TaxID=3048640 RepID=UPI002AB52B22|nr:M3 family metallopeptidase [Herbaspirillum sp. RTI4]MDY7577993.1 M3 family metallopeptidase [Herbaspirillum sp. RTI4]MEA9982077.1 M3 family metallopeptidase [Herbaspirillum sp. RTI4]